MNMRKRITILLMIALLALSAFSGCAEEMPRDFGEGSSNSYNPMIMADGNAVYSEFYKARFDRSSGEITAICQDPECSGNCLLENSLLTLCGIEDRKLFFSALHRGDDNAVYFASVNTENGEVQVLREVREEDNAGTLRYYVNGGYIYYNTVQLPEGGDKNNFEDYDKFFCRMPSGGGKEEVLRQVRGWAETLIAAADGKLVSYWNNVIWLSDLTGGEPIPVLDLEKLGCTGCGIASTYGDRIYLLSNKKTSGVAAPNGTHPNESYCFVISAGTGEAKKLLEEPIISFCVAAEGVYFYPTEVRMMSDPAKYLPEDAKAVYLFGADTLYLCDHDGQNVHSVWKDTQGLIDFVEDYTIVDGTYYGWVDRFNREENHWESRFDWAEVDLGTGEMILTPYKGGRSQ